VTTPATTEYHFVMSGQFTHDSSPEWFDGTVHVGPGATRAEVLQYVRGLVASKKGGAVPVVTFWSLEPNQLTPPAPAPAVPAEGEPTR
jgi:hypothetical protein